MVLTDLHLIIEVNIHSALQPEVLHQCFLKKNYFITYEQKNKI